MTESWSIGLVSARAGIKVETIRYYERIGMMPPVKRSVKGRRIYNSQDLARLMFIKRGRVLGFTLADIKALMMLENPLTGDVRAQKIARRHLDTVREHLRHLQILEDILVKAINDCATQSGTACPIVDIFKQEYLREPHPLCLG